MPQDTLGFMARLNEYGVWGYAWILVISLWAGTVKYLTTLKGERPTLFDWLTETVVSGFVGVLTAMICQYYALDFLLTSAITGVAAHNGTRSLYILSEVIKKNTAIQFNEEKKQSNTPLKCKQGDKDDS